MAANNELLEKRDEIRFDIVRNVFYHSARRRALESANRAVTFLIILLGTATASSAMALFGFDPSSGAFLLGGLVTVLASLQLVYDLAVRAKNHEVLYRDYMKLLARIDRKADIDQQDIGEWNAEFAEIAATEPPTMRALDAVAHNEAAQALYGDDVPTLKIPFVHYVTKNLFAFSGTVFDEVPARRRLPAK